MSAARHTAISTVSALILSAVVGLFGYMNYAQWQADAAVWEEPTCDPATDPASCNIAPPLNTSSVGQTKAGDITFEGSFTLDDGAPGSVTNGALTLPGDIIVDGMVNDDITAQSFTRSGSGTAAVDLNQWDAVNPVGVDVVGALPAGAITDEWVDETGQERVSGYLYLDPADVNAVTPDPDDALTIDVENSLSARGVYIENSTTVPNAVGVDVNVTSSSIMGIRTQTVATSGVGIYANSTGTGSYGVLAQGMLNGVYGFVPATGDSGGTGVYGQSEQGSGVHGVSTEAGYAGVTGDVVATNVVGVRGQSNIDHGVDGNTVQTGNPYLDYYGVRGCKNSITCGYLGGEFFAMRADGNTDTRGRSYVGDTVEKVSPTTNAFTSSIGEIRRGRLVDTSKLNHLQWQDNVTDMISDGDELWILNSDGSAPDSNLSRLDTQTAQTNAVSDFTGGVHFEALTVNEDGAYSIRLDGLGAGDLYYWPKQDLGATTNTTSLVGATGVPDVVELSHYYNPSITGANDNFRLIAGRKAAGAGDLLYSIDPSLTFGPAPLLSLPRGDMVHKIVVDNLHNIYALVEITSLGTGVDFQLWQINGYSQTFVQSWDLISGVNAHKSADMVFDGQYLWVVADTAGTAAEDGLWRLEPATDTMQFFEMESKNPIFDSPVSIEFDGQYLWVGLSGSDSIVRVLPYSENGEDLQVMDNQEYDVEETPYHLEFDGQHLWVMTKWNSSGGAKQEPLKQVTTGNTYGNTSTTFQSGINLFSVRNSGGSYVDPQPVCVFVDWDSTAGNYVLKVAPTVCPGG